MKHRFLIGIYGICGFREAAFQRLHECIFLLAEGDRVAGFYRDGKDIIIPAVSDLPLAHNFGGEPRPILASFRGLFDHQLRGPQGEPVTLRNKLRRLLKTTGKRVSGHRIVVGGRKDTYAQEMLDSLFCLVPRGNTPWTRRLFDAIMSGCIPVVLSNAIVFPFESDLDWSLFTLKLPESFAAGPIWDILADLKLQTPCITRISANLAAVAPVFAVGSKVSAIEVVTAALGNMGERKKRRTRNSESTFWLPPSCSSGGFSGYFDLQGNEGRQVGPSFSAGARPYPEEDQLWRGEGGGDYN